MLRQMCTARRPVSQIPSAQRARHHSSSGTGIAWILQNPAVCLRSMHPAPGISAREPLDIGRPGNGLGHGAAPSWLAVSDAPQALPAPHLWVPTDVAPLLLILKPRAYKSRSSQRASPESFRSLEKVIHLRLEYPNGHTFLFEWLNPISGFKSTGEEHQPASMPRNRTHLLSYVSI